MVRFDRVVGVALSVVPRRWNQFVEHGRVHRCRVGDDLARRHLQRGQRSAEEPTGRSSVAAGRDEHRLSDDEGRRLQQIARRGTGSPIRLRRAMVIMASASGNTVPAIARPVQGDEDADPNGSYRERDGAAS
ncbi:hypothetical protein GCM10022255_113880 [Dactylosporangium darangshiense]|uniref:Transposase n=1 Tax=Dactylosporangium darangshiense TaxID=579108 RepID=A0ABP8DVI3_9ACTN